MKPPPINPSYPDSLDNFYDSLQLITAIIGSMQHVIGPLP